MAECAAELTEVLDRLDRVEKKNRRLKRAGLAVLVLTGVVLLSASTVAQVGVPGGVNPFPPGLSGNATQIHGKAVDAPATLGQMPFYDGTKIGWFIDPVVRMNRDCGIVGSGDETAALNTCIANLQNHTGVLQCDKPAMAIHTSGVVIRDKIGIRIETAGGGHSLNNACQLVYTGSAGGTVVDVERTRDSVIFKGFQIYAGAADIAIQTGQTGNGTNIATSDSFEEMAVINNKGRSTFVGFMIGDSTGNNSDEMQFQHVSVSSQGCTKCGTAFKSVTTNVYGTEFRGIILLNLAVGWDWQNNASVNKVGGYGVALLYKLQSNSASFHVQHEDLEQIDQILSTSNGSIPLIEENGRVILNTPAAGGVTGTSGHPAWDTGNLKVRNMQLGPPAQLAGLTFLKGSVSTRADVDFYDPGIATYGAGSAVPPANVLNGFSKKGFLTTAFGNSNWIGDGFVDEKGMAVPGVGMQAANGGNGLRQDFTPCTRGNVCFNEGQVELTGVHSIFNTPAISYTGTAGSTTRSYAIVACSDTACAAGTRSIPSYAVFKHHTKAALDGSNYITLTWTPALGVNKYGILQQQVGSPNNWNLLMSNVSCSTNPCTINITTDSGSYATVYPSANETGGVILRGAIKMGKSATQVAAVDFTYATVTGLNLTTVPLTYSHAGTRQTAAHLVVDSCTLGTDCSVTLTGAAVFTSASSYSCVCQDETAIASCKVAQTSGSAFAITGTGTDTIRYFCAGN